MKADEIKLRVHRFIEDTIDLYMPPTGFLDKIKNSTAKFWVEQNIWKLNNAIDAFKDENGEICEEKLRKCYEETLFEDGELRLDVTSILPDTMESVKAFLPNKIIVFNKADLDKLLHG